MSLDVRFKLECDHVAKLPIEKGCFLCIPGALYRGYRSQRIPGVASATADGIGCILFGNGDKYMGRFECGRLLDTSNDDWIGHWFFASSKQTYCGEVKNGRAHGEGVYQLAPNEQCRGTFRDGELLEGALFLGGVKQQEFKEGDNLPRPKLTWKEQGWPYCTSKYCPNIVIGEHGCQCLECIRMNYRSSQIVGVDCDGGDVRISRQTFKVDYFVRGKFENFALPPGPFLFYIRQNYLSQAFPPDKIEEVRHLSNTRKHAIMIIGEPGGLESELRRDVVYICKRWGYELRESDLPDEDHYELRESELPDEDHYEYRIMHKDFIVDVLWNFTVQELEERLPALMHNILATDEVLISFSGHANLDGNMVFSDGSLSGKDLFENFGELQLSPSSMALFFNCCYAVRVAESIRPGQVQYWTWPRSSFLQAMKTHLSKNGLWSPFSVELGSKEIAKYIGGKFVGPKKETSVSPSFA